MVHLRISCVSELAPPVLEYLSRLDLSAQIAHFPGACQKPNADLIVCDLPRESASAVITALRELGLDDGGSILVHGIDAAVSPKADEASARAPGAAADAVLWEQVQAQTSDSAELTGTYLAFMIVATVFGAIGVLTDSLILIVGAMVVGPEFGPLAGLCVATIDRRWGLARRSALALALGFVLAILAAYATVHLLVWSGVAPAGPVQHPATLFISRPDAYSAIVATLAGVVGMLSLTTSKSGALIGVLISVTTIPAAGNIAVAAAYSDTGEVRGAIAQLGLNLALLVVAGLATLAIQRLAFAHRLRQLVVRAIRPR